MANPLSQSKAAKLVKRRHPEWREHQRDWRRLADSLESGERYRLADYASDPTTSPVHPWFLGGRVDNQTGQGAPFDYQSIVDRNLVPHRREMSDEGVSLYLLRLTRTPTPTALSRTIESHLSKVFARPIERVGPPALVDWWSNVDGRRAPIRRWVEEEVAPLLLALGQLDILCDHPPAANPATIDTMADQIAAGLTRCVATVVLPENVVWWKLDWRGDYEEALVIERSHDDDGRPVVRYRHWTATDGNCYTPAGVYIESESREHAFGAVPMVRVFDRRKPRCENVGKSRYAGIAELQRSRYNTESELILGDIHQSHAQLSGPEEYLSDASGVPIGPDAILPMKPVMGPSGVAGYQGWEYIDPAKGAQDAIRQHAIDCDDRIDREGSLAKPAGLVSGTTTGQSGISKAYDQADGNAILTRVAEVLQSAEEQVAAMALRVLLDRPPTEAELEAIHIDYPDRFDLYSADDVSAVLESFQSALARAGQAPLTEAALLKQLLLLGLPGIDPEDLRIYHEEIDAKVAEAAAAIHGATNHDAGGLTNGRDTGGPGHAGDPAGIATDQSMD